MVLQKHRGCFPRQANAMQSKNIGPTRGKATPQNARCAMTQDCELLLQMEVTMTKMIMTLAVLLTFAAIGCHTAPPVPVQSASRTPVVVRIAILVDVSRSIERTFTPQVRADELEPAINIVRERGGELAVGLISDNSNVPLRRVRIEPFLEPEPVEPTERNPFKRAQQRGAYEQALAAYKERRRRWEAEAESKIQDFKRELVGLLNRPADAPRTDICTALFRADLFLNEPSWDHIPTRKIIVIVSDCQDNVHRVCPPLTDEQTTVIVVTGWADLGALLPFRPVRFESFSAALNYMKEVIVR